MLPTGAFREAETAMRRERSSLEDQVGGLIDHGGRRSRRRDAQQASASDPVEPERYDLTGKATVAIRAARASGEPAHRRVA
jgi:hypothetical protein